MLDSQLIATSTHNNYNYMFQSFSQIHQHYRKKQARRRALRYRRLEEDVVQNEAQSEARPAKAPRQPVSYPFKAQSAGIHNTVF